MGATFCKTSSSAAVSQMVGKGERNSFQSSCTGTSGLSEEVGSSPGTAAAPTDERKSSISSKKSFTSSKKTLTQNIVTESSSDIRQFYEIGEGILGTGVTGTVKVVTHIQTRTEYALKTLVKKKLKAENLHLLRVINKLHYGPSSFGVS